MICDRFRVLSRCYGLVECIRAHTHSTTMVVSNAILSLQLLSFHGDEAVLAGFEPGTKLRRGIQLASWAWACGGCFFVCAWLCTWLWLLSCRGEDEPVCIQCISLHIVLICFLCMCVKCNVSYFNAISFDFI